MFPLKVLRQMQLKRKVACFHFYEDLCSRLCTLLNYQQTNTSTSVNISGYTKLHQLISI